MKVITRKIPARVSVVYQCEKCKARHRSKKNALKCEAMPIEAKFFKIGEQVVWNGWWHCKPANKTYRFVGKVVNITGPLVIDYDYDHRWFGGKMSGKHVYEYEVQWDCLRCKRAHAFLFYSCQFKKHKTRD